jgi:hypothetical protein
VRNLLSNAIKFTEQGAVRVEIVAPAADTLFTTEDLSADNALAISVIDEGVGIPADRVEQIFEAFEQVDASTIRTYGGTGLGLSISRELARMLGGELSVESELGAGSRFTLYIRRALDSSIAVSQSVTAQAETRRIDDPSAQRFRPPARARAKPVAGDTQAQAAPDALHVLIIDDDAQFSNVIAQAAGRRQTRLRLQHRGRRGKRSGHGSPAGPGCHRARPGLAGHGRLDRT